MIIIGYPGIGKSTLCHHRENCIDLESSCFDKSNKNWYKDYCNVAVDLHEQGNIVLVSNHDLVYKELSSKDVLNTTNLVFVFPSLQLRDDWITKLGDRYNKEKTKKNEAAWLRATNCYFEDILNLVNFVKKSGFRYCCINRMEYQLDYIVRGLEEGKTSNNIDEANKVCGLCKHFLGMGDYNLCCDKQYDLTYTFSKPCDMFERK